ncbi:hypothetical protein ACEP28_32580 [Pseudomonas aeruginosa]|uniref:hypothetical protein n=1 Tax=Pseudomonas aeruginosa TaxID=287 RepID=UPI001ADABF3C|nr:hypothetical protein [Pseudomonas aeruginosa]MBO8337140.1 hypothetical protein [Pseudomonas aeruginosa]HCF4080832.1 hypothetical protein [Pseudomonas aeruginosa]
MLTKALRNQKAAARRFAQGNLPRLAADVLVWQRSAVLPADSLMHALAGLCGYVSESYAEAERLVAQLALEQAAQTAQAGSPEQGEQATGHALADQVGPGSDAYQRMLPKLLEMSAVVDSMTDAQYAAWINSLEEDEFLAYIAVSTSPESLTAAVAEAKAMIRS